MGEFHFLPSGAPNERHGGDGDWAFTEDGHFYFKSAGSWAQKDGAGGGGSAPAGVHVTHKFPFAFNTPNLLRGATVVFTDGYTPAVEDILHDAWIEIDTAWDGITPKGNIGTFRTGSGGWFVQPVDMTNFDGDIQTSDGLQVAFQPSSLANQDVLINVASNMKASAGPDFTISDKVPFTNSGERNAGGKFTALHPLKVVVSQDGSNVGADPGSTQGAAILYVVTSTPA